MSDEGDMMRSWRRSEQSRVQGLTEALKALFDSMEIEIGETNAQGAVLVPHYSETDRHFYYYPKSGKWRVEGDSTVYRSASAAQFLTNYADYSTAALTRGVEGITQEQYKALTNPNH
jgi:hypothetical protein